MGKAAERLKPLFYPNTVAVIGASDDPVRLGYFYLKSLASSFKGTVYLINSRLAGREILNRKCYASIREIPESVDLALLIVSAHLTLDVLRECAESGVKAAIVFAAGFAESMGEKGREVESGIRKISEETGMVIVGPNCLGVVNVSVGLNTLLEAVIPEEPGKISFISHSGSLTDLFLTLSSKRGFYVGKAVSSGNEAATTLNDYLEYFIEDPETGVIAMYIEAIRDGRKFLKLCRSTTKPLVALKAGRTETGRMAARSHTAALAGSAEVWRGVCRQAGIIQAETFEELYDLAMALACPLRPKGNRVGIVTGPGGPAVIATDACEELGLKVPRLTRESRKEIGKILPPFASTLNPIDLTATALEDIGLYERVLRVVVSDPNVDSLIVIPPMLKQLVDVARVIVEIVREQDKPVVVAWTTPPMLGASQYIEALKLLSRNQVPSFFMPERAAKALLAMLTQTYIEKKKKKAETV